MTRRRSGPEQRRVRLPGVGPPERRFQSADASTLRDKTGQTRQRLWRRDGRCNGLTERSPQTRSSWIEKRQPRMRDEEPTERGGPVLRATTEAASVRPRRVGNLLSQAGSQLDCCTIVYCFATCVAKSNISQADRHRRLLGGLFFFRFGSASTQVRVFLFHRPASAMVRRLRDPWKIGTASRDLLRENAAGKLWTARFVVHESGKVRSSRKRSVSHDKR